MSIKLGTLELDVDTDDEFRYISTLAIDPPLSAGEIKKIKTDFFQVQQVKDEDVKLVNGQIVVVSENVTKFTITSDYSVPGIDNLYRDLESIGNAASRELQGDVIVSFLQDTSVWPLIARFTIGTAGKVSGELARLYWPSNGTTSPMPS